MAKTRAIGNPCFAVKDADGAVIGYWRKYTNFTCEAIPATSLRQAEKELRTTICAGREAAIRYLKGLA